MPRPIPLLLALIVWGCGGSGPGGACKADADGDGDGFDRLVEGCETTGPVDCDDADPAVNPGADELCDGVDNNCDGTTDDSRAVDAPTWYTDADGDGYGAMEAGISGCEAPPGTVANGDDCDDGDPLARPAGDDSPLADGDCDGAIGNLAVAPTIGGWGAMRLGHRVASAGDWNSDGLADFAIGAPDSDGANGLRSGSVHVVLGSAGGLVPGQLIPEDGEIFCAAVDDNCNIVGRPGDVDGDDVLDILVGSTVHQQGRGRVWLVAGGSDLTAGVDLGQTVSWLGRQDGELAGSAVALVDLDGNGFAEMVVGAPAATSPYDAVPHGGVYVMPGSEGLFYPGGDGILSSSSAVFGVAPDSAYGRDVDSAGDFDGDGWTDLVVGAPDETLQMGAGAVWIAVGGVPSMFGQGVSGLLVGEPGDFAGARVAGVGDVDGDGLDDVLAGAAQDSPVEAAGPSGPGRAYLILGRAGDPPTGLLRDLAAATLEGAAPHERAGLDVSGAGDVDGDGTVELLIGAPGPVDETGLGAVWLVSSATPLTGAMQLEDVGLLLQSGAAGDSLGRALAGIGDANGDGLDDLAIAAPTYTDPGFGPDEQAGRVFVVFGQAF